jgi:flagellar protein FliL
MESAAELPLQTDPSAESTPSKLPKILAIVIGVGIGAAAGVYVAGPAAIKRFIPDPKVVAAKAAAEKKAAPEAPRVLHVVDNLVLNPANSGGTRFLMVSATFEVKDAAAAEQLKERDAEIRDALLALFGKKTVEQLTDVNEREAVKAEVMSSVAPLFAPGTVKKVFFPQFVIQ